MFNDKTIRLFLLEHLFWPKFEAPFWKTTLTHIYIDAVLHVVVSAWQVVLNQKTGLDALGYTSVKRSEETGRSNQSDNEIYCEPEDSIVDLNS